MAKLRREEIFTAPATERATGEIVLRTAPGTERPRSKTAGLAGGLALCVLLLAMLLVCMPGLARSDGREVETSVLSPSGIRYPGGYDPNTVGDIKGKVQRIIQPESGPVQVHVFAGREAYIVLTSPAAFWKNSGSGILEGTDVFVRGSKALGADGRLYIVAQEIRDLKTGESIVLRKDDGAPAWAGSRTGTSGSGAGFGSPMRGGGGGLRGPGAGGHGRR